LGSFPLEKYPWQVAAKEGLEGSTLNILLFIYSAVPQASNSIRPESTLDIYFDKDPMICTQSPVEKSS